MLIRSFLVLGAALILSLGRQEFMAPVESSQRSLLPEKQGITSPDKGMERQVKDTLSILVSPIFRL